MFSYCIHVQCSTVIVLAFYVTHVRKAMEHEGTGEQSIYQCVHLLSHLVTMCLDMGKLTDLLGQILSHVKFTRALSVMLKGFTPIR